MKNWGKKISVFVICFAMAGLGIFGAVRYMNDRKEAENEKKKVQENGVNSSEAWGEYLAERANEDSDSGDRIEGDIYAEGKRAVITVDDMKQTIEYYAVQGISEEEAEKQAYEYMKESASLYQEALEQGYSVTDEEVRSYVESLKEMMSSEELDEISREQIDNVISGFGNEEEYWKYQEEVYQELLVSQKYVGDLQRKFYEDGANGQEEWISYFENFKRKLVEEEDFQIVGELK